MLNATVYNDYNFSAYNVKPKKINCKKQKQTVQEFILMH